MKDKSAVLYFRRGFLVPLCVPLSERTFLVPIRVGFQKKCLRAEQIEAPGQTEFIIECRRNIRVCEPVRTMTQDRRRQRNDPALALEISARAKCQPGEVG